MEQSLNLHFNKIARLKKSIKNNTKKCEKIELEIKHAQEVLTNISHLEHSEHSSERLQYLDAQRQLKLLTMTLANTRALIACQVLDLEKLVGKQNQFQFPTLGE